MGGSILFVFSSLSYKFLSIFGRRLRVSVAFTNLYSVTKYCMCYEPTADFAFSHRSDLTLLDTINKNSSRDTALSPSWSASATMA